MKFFKNLSIKAKLIALAGFLSVMLLITGGVGFFGVHESKDAMNRVYSEHVTALNDLNEVRNYQLQLQMELLSARLETDAFEIQAYNDRVDKFIYEISKLLDVYKQRVTEPEEKRLMEAFLAARLNFGVKGVTPMKDLLIAERFDEANTHYTQVLVPAYKESAYALDTLIKYQVDAARAAYDKISRLTIFTELIAGITTMIGLALSVALSLAVSISITRNVTQLRNAANKVAKGDLTARAGVCCKDELGEVGESFDLMVTEFSSLIGQVHSSTEQVTSEATLLASAADDVSQGSDAQISQASAAAVSAEQLDTAVRNVSERLAQVVSVTDQAGNQADHGQRVVNDAVKGIEDVARTVEESVSMIASLGHRSDEIGRIVQVIKDIADQTNLLALNAAIEAARAGEQGRGFAVVADEVRKLAERTTNATTEISGMIQAIQHETGQAVQVMERGNRQVTDGVSLANQAGRALNEINGGVRQVVALIREISDASHAQATAADDIARRVEEIARAAQSNGSSVQQVVGAAQELRVLSQTLEGSVSRFRL